MYIYKYIYIRICIYTHIEKYIVHTLHYTKQNIKSNERKQVNEVILSSNGAYIFTIYGIKRHLSHYQEVLMNYSYQYSQV